MGSVDCLQAVEAVNEFHSWTDGQLRPGACDETFRFERLGEETKLLQVLSWTGTVLVRDIQAGEEQCEDTLFRVCKELLQIQNDFLHHAADFCVSTRDLMLRCTLSDLRQPRGGRLSVCDIEATGGGLMTADLPRAQAAGGGGAQPHAFTRSAAALCLEAQLTRTRPAQPTFDLRHAQRIAAAEYVAGHVLTDNEGMLLAETCKLRAFPLQEP